MAIQRTDVQQKQSRVTGSLSSSVASKQREANNFNKQANVMQSISDDFAQAGVKQLQANAEKKAMEDAGKGKLDTSSTQYTVYGQAYAKKANTIAQTNFTLKLEEAEGKARVNNELSIEGYNAEMQEFYDTQTEGITDDQLIYRQQAYDASSMRGEKAIVKNKTDKVNGEYTASIKAWAEESRKQILQMADEGDKQGYKNAQNLYVEAVSELLENQLITPEKATLMIKSQYDEGTEEYVMSDFDMKLAKSVDDAIAHAEKFSITKDEDMFESGDLLYDVPQRDAMYAKMTAKIKAQTTTDKVGRARIMKYNNGQAKNAIEVLIGGGEPDNMAEVMAYTVEEIDPLLYEELRAQKAQLPERVVFKSASALEQRAHIDRLQAKKQSGKGLSVYESRLLDGYEKKHSEKIKTITNNPSKDRVSSLSGSMITLAPDLSNMTEYLQGHQPSVNAYANENGSKRWYFENEVEAKYVTDMYNEKEPKEKIEFIATITDALGEDAKYALSQLGLLEPQMQVLSQVLALDDSQKTATAIMKGLEMRTADKSLVPKGKDIGVDVVYNALDKSSMTGYTDEMQTQVKQDVISLAVANNGGGEASNIDGDALKTAYEQIVGATVKDNNWFGFSQTVVAPWAGARYVDFEYAIDEMNPDDMPANMNATEFTGAKMLELLQEGGSDIQYLSVGVGEYQILIQGTRMTVPTGEPMDIVDENGKVVGTRNAMQPYILKITK